MIFFRKDYNTREYFIDGNDLLVRGTDRSIDFRDKPKEDKAKVKWYKVNNNKREILILLGDVKSKSLEIDYQNSLKNKETEK
tara:strand:- start:21694 stop:21939 length:246 start_codon:yes stop_codon:yes gene_type:complete